MFSGRTETTNGGKKKWKKKDRAAEIAETFEWLIITFALVFVWRAFVMEAFRIPTGSMADTLKGAHFRLRCPQCGYKYNYGFVPERYGYRSDTIPHKYLKETASRCPSCGHYQPTGGTMPISNGDRILVLKCKYQFFQPKRWDVVVFRNPTQPSINFIKRLVGLPGEKVEIIDGDVYIDGQIFKKPTKVQNQLWMPVYDNDYQPVRPGEPFFNGHFWEQPFKKTSDSSRFSELDGGDSNSSFVAGSAEKGWILGDKDNPTVFRLDSPADQIHSFFYDTTAGNDFHATYAYDDVRQYGHMPYCSDLMVRFYIRAKESQGQIGISLSKYQTTYNAWVDYAGCMVITKTEKSRKTIELERRTIKAPATNKTTLVKFANVDHQLVFQFGNEVLTRDLGGGPDDAGQRKPEIQPQVKIFGSSSLVLSHIAIFRDIHYTRYKFGEGSETGRATEGDPFTLGEDEFFVLGDNSPSSEDSRWWSSDGLANRGLSYRAGIVPRDYLVGKALFVYWPGGFEAPWPEGLKTSLLRSSRNNPISNLLYGFISWKWIPCIGQMRFIYGGSDKGA